VSKLVCVEYSPKVSSKSSGGRSGVTPLSGCVGETLERYLNPNTRSSQTTIPVRFPLSGQGVRADRWRAGRDPLDPYQLEVEALDISPDELYVLRDRVPTSLYERVKLTDPKTLFERPVYMSTFSRDGMTEMLKDFAKVYRNSWIWSWGTGPTKTPQTSPYEPVFIEARVYGIDTVIGTYDARKFDGVALEVIHKPFPSQAMIDQGIKVMRARSNVYLFSNYEEYVNYVDGVKLGREKTNYVSIISKYGKFLTPKQGASLRKAMLSDKKETKKDPEPPKKEKKSTYTYSYAQVAKDMFTTVDTGTSTNTTNLGVWPIGENK